MRYGLSDFNPDFGRADARFRPRACRLWRRRSRSLSLQSTDESGPENPSANETHSPKLAHGPAPDLLIAVAGGVGYIVPVSNPAGYSVIPLRPVTDVQRMPAVGLVICVGLTALAAGGPEGNLRWSSPRLVANGFREVRIATSSIVVRGWDAPAHRNVEVTLDPRSGDVIART